MIHGINSMSMHGNMTCFNQLDMKSVVIDRKKYCQTKYLLMNQLDE